MTPALTVEKPSSPDLYHAFPPEFADLARAADLASLRSDRLTSVGGIVMGLGVLAGAATADEPLVYVIVGIVFVALGALHGVLSRGNPPFLKALSVPGNRVTWVYALEVFDEQVKTTAFGIHVGFSNGMKAGLDVGTPALPGKQGPQREKSAALLEQCRVAFPDAVFGHSPENEQAFKNDPRSLR